VVGEKQGQGRWQGLGRGQDGISSWVMGWYQYSRRRLVVIRGNQGVRLQYSAVNMSKSSL
jgi:hypothetical protein